MLDEEAQTESQDNEMEQEAIIDETGVAPSSQEDDDGVLHGPALPPPSHVPIPQETNSPPPLEQEDSVSADSHSKPALPVAAAAHDREVDKSNQEEEEESEDVVTAKPSDGQQIQYLGPTADYLGTKKDEEIVVTPSYRKSQVRPSFYSSLCWQNLKF